jgi:hypothetical protein
MAFDPGNDAHITVLADTGLTDAEAGARAGLKLPDYRRRKVESLMPRRAEARAGGWPICVV